jgi:tetratricopeptide (TPR) repeat protein
MDLYVPVTYTAWSGVALVSRAVSRDGSPDPRVFHAASVLVHAFNAVLVFLLLRRLLKIPWPAAAGAMLFALHPVQVETVAWASGFKDLLCATFSLIALHQYVLAVQTTAADERARSIGRRRLHHALGLLGMLLGMLSKPTAMVTPMLAVAIDLLVLGRSWRRVLFSATPYFALAIPCVVWTKLCQPASYLRHVPVWQRPLIAADALAFYLYKLLLPVRLTYDYGRSPWTIFQKHWAWFTWLAPAGVAAGLIVSRQRARPLVAAALLLVIGVAPVLGLTTFDFEMISTVADHYLYLAMLGPALAAAWALTRLPAANRLPALATCLVLALCAARSADQMRHWQDSRAFFAHTLELNPQSWSAWYGLGYLDHMEGRELAARATAEAAHGIDPTPDRLAANDRLREAMNSYQHAVELNEFDLAAHHGYGAMLLYFGRYQEAGRQFVEVLRRRNSLAPSMRPNYYADTDFLGQCLFFCGRADEAAEVFRDAAALRPAPADAALHLRAAEAVVARRNAARPAITDTRKEAAEGN